MSAFLRIVSAYKIKYQRQIFKKSFLQFYSQGDYASQYQIYKILIKTPKVGKANNQGRFF